MNYKDNLRRLYKARRKSLTDNERVSLSLAIASLIDTFDWNSIKYCHVFMTIDNLCEVDTIPIIKYLWSKHKEVLVPRIIPGSIHMQHFFLEAETKLLFNSYKIPEPESGKTAEASLIDLVFVPLLAYDLHGNRVGYGKGYYDMFLQKCRPDTLKVGLSFFEPETKIADVSNSDIPLDACISPYRIYRFK